MAFREVTVLEVKEVLRLWRDRVSKKRIAAQLGLDVKTVRRYLKQLERASLEPGTDLDVATAAAATAAWRRRPWRSGSRWPRGGRGVKGGIGAKSTRRFSRCRASLTTSPRGVSPGSDATSTPSWTRRCTRYLGTSVVRLRARADSHTVRIYQGRGW